jgi:hypothetical protein
MSIRRYAVLVALASLVGRASAQSLSTPTFLNQSNPNELFTGSASVPSFERETAPSILSSAAGAFVTRFVALVTADGDGGPGAGLGESLFADYTISFSATAPGAYRLTVDTALRGDLHLVNDGANGGTADIGAVSGFSTGGTVIAGSFGLPDAGIVGGSSGAASSIDESNEATIFGVSNGAPVAHTLRFQWSSAASTDATPGDEAAVRLGATSDVPSETAGDYPGSPARVQLDDGHFVTVTIESLCGNGVIDAGPSYTEACDAGPVNGQPGSCCTASCTFVTTGVSCNDGNACTTGETCTSGVCGGGTVQTCPLCQTCDPLGGCAEGPRTGCTVPTTPFKAKLQLKDRTNDASDLLNWKWLRGGVTQTSDFGDPVTTDDFALCIFNGSNLLLQADAPASGTCGTKPCWKPISIKGFNYKDKDRSPDGLDKVLLKAGLAGKAKALVKGKGGNLPDLPLPLPLPAVVQLQSENGKCWESTFYAAGQQANDSTQFKGKAGSPSGAFLND